MRNEFFHFRKVWKNRRTWLSEERVTVKCGRLWNSTGGGTGTVGEKEEEVLRVAGRALSRNLLQSSSADRQQQHLTAYPSTPFFLLHGASSAEFAVLAALTAINKRSSCTTLPSDQSPLLPRKYLTSFPILNDGVVWVFFLFFSLFSFFSFSFVKGFFLFEFLFYFILFSKKDTIHLVAFLHLLTMCFFCSNYYSELAFF